jgi:copper(I)-binding protein
MRRSAALLVLGLALTVAACSPGGGATATGGGIVTVSGAWVRAAAKGAMTAAYLQVVNGRLSDETLVGVSTDAAAKASLHQTTTDNDGMTGMQPVDGITIPAGKTVMLEPGGYHIMLEGLTADLAAGSQIRLVLTFEQGGPLNVTAEVRAN